MSLEDEPTSADLLHHVDDIAAQHGCGRRRVDLHRCLPDRSIGREHADGAALDLDLRTLERTDQELGEGSFELGRPARDIARSTDAERVWREERDQLVDRTLRLHPSEVLMDRQNRTLVGAHLHLLRMCSWPETDR